MKRLWFLGESAVLFGTDQLMKTYVEQNLDRGEEKNGICVQRASGTAS